MREFRMFKPRMIVLAAALMALPTLALMAPAAGQQKTTIGVSLAQDDNPFYIAMLRGIRARAEELGWDDQDAVGAPCPRLGDLINVIHEILAQDWELGR